MTRNRVFCKKVNPLHIRFLILILNSKKNHEKFRFSDLPENVTRKSILMREVQKLGQFGII